MKKTKQRDLRTISQMQNLGPACERDLNAAGIRTAEDLKRLGPETAFLKMLQAQERNGRRRSCCNAAYLYAIYGALHNLDWREIPTEKKEEFKAFTAERRRFGQFATRSTE